MIKWQMKSVLIKDLHDYKHNPRKISDNEFSKLVNSLKEDGYHQRILVNKDNVIIGGHQRKKALIESGLSLDDTLEVLMPNRLLTDEELDRINIRDNLSFGEYDFDILRDRFDIETLQEFGMSDTMLDAFNDGEIITLEDDNTVLEVPIEAKAALGDLYILGSHRLYCGDSTNPQHVERLLNGATPILMVTDPPYGVNYEPEWRNNIGVQQGVSKNLGKVLNDDKYDWSEAYSLFTGDIAYIWHSAKYTHKFADNIENCGFDLINLIIWSKQHFVLSRGDYHNQHEPLWYVVRKGKQHNWQGKRDQSTIWQIDNNNYGVKDKEEQTGHGTQKPLECMLRPILNNSKLGEGIYDPFGGSGTTLIACEKSKRNCYMMELSPNYIDMIIKRWEDNTALKAVLVKDEQ